MANPLKILTALQVSGALSTSGSLSVGGNGSLSVGGNTAITSTVIGSTSFQVTGSAISSSGVIIAANGLTVNGAALNASTVEVSASSLSVTNSALIGGSLTITGDLTVNGTTTTVDTQNLLVEDAVIQLGSGSGGNSNGDRGFIFSRASENKAFFWDDSDSKFKLAATITSGTTNLIVPGTAQALDVGALSATSVVASSGLTVSGTTNLSGAILFKSNTEIVDFLSTSSLNDLTGALNTIVNYIGSLESQIPNVSTLVEKSSYDSRRSVVYGTKGSGDEGIRVLLSGNLNVGSFSSAYVTGGNVQISASSANSLIDQARHLSIDVAVRGDGWVNDLTSVKISASQGAGGDSAWYPYIVIDAPAASTNAEIRLIVVNEKSLS